MNKIIINKNIYPIDVILSACYTLLNKAYFLLDEDDKKNIIINIQPKPEFKGDIEGELKDELLNCLSNQRNIESTKEIRQKILQRALLLNEYGGQKQEKNEDKIKNQ